MMTSIALPLLILLAAVLLVLAITAMQRHAQRRDHQLSVSGRATFPPGPPPPRARPSGRNGDAAKLQQLIAIERRLSPTSSEAELELRAHQRMQRERGKN